MDGSAFEAKSSFKLDWGSYIISIAKTVSKKIRALTGYKSFSFLKLIYISINLRYSHAWNTAVMSGLVSLVATWNC